MSSDRELKFFMARVADQAERHEDVIQYIKEIIDIDPKLSLDERNLLSVAYKALTGNRRTALRSVNAFLEDPSIQGAKERENRLIELRNSLIKELDDYCNSIVKFVDDKLLPAADDAISKVFYWKLKADYFRYSVEFKDEAARAQGSEAAKKAYEEAMNLAKDLSKANPQYLGLALNYSVFLYEIIGQKNEAIELADKSFKEAVGLIDKLEEDEYSEATLILQLLKDNVQLWTDDQNAE
ncbi:14-3-3 protein [Trichomonas vaginalis G3]|uniref:14-3-3 protein n=1 Tax=Trichomonas vaginalis (strain ATCC PRA-98 / G3) TaxID=412133 RepID=A2EU51_TRIV3|nr:protein domain specific binding [Trichomonas vaginalis G3]EAY03799.1 14-3-3 protein [Trichomonas vaginalis G3]KAI5552628.1 protein domain specific binding [Trichomonas vaginalis G3]|eukprot:XP_001316022.1 14-3-3 protein [Trichomonas vaginalis G3]